MEMFGLARDALTIGLIFGVFGFGWFGWAQEDPPQAWRPRLGAGSVACGLMAIGSGIALYLNRDAETFFAGRDAGLAMGLQVGIEVVIGLAGALVLIKRGLGRYLAAWICAVVGVHFVPLAVMFANPVLVVPAVAMVVVAVLAVRWGSRTGRTVSAVTGVGAGLTLGLTGLAHLFSGLVRLG